MWHLRALLPLLLFAVAGTSVARESHLHFTPARAAAAEARRDADELVRFAASALDTRLDWSEESVRRLDELAASLHVDLRRGHARPADVAPLVAMIGCYLGETLRRHHGGDWGRLVVNGRSLLGFRPAEGVAFAPVESVRRRVERGAAGGLWRIYRANARGVRATAHAGAAQRVAPLATISATSAVP